MASIRNEVALRASVTEVWDAVRDFGALPTRLVPGFVTKCELDGADARIVTFANGLEARELLVDCDDNARRLAYAIVGGRAAHYGASVQVREGSHGGATLTWIVDLLPNELAPAIGAMAGQAVAAMKKQFGAAA